MCGTGKSVPRVVRLTLQLSWARVDRLRFFRTAFSQLEGCKGIAFSLTRRISSAGVTEFQTGLSPRFARRPNDIGIAERLGMRQAFIGQCDGLGR